jgi:hypothetical protein
MYGGGERCIQDFDRESEERIPLGRPRIYKRWDRAGARTEFNWLRIRTGGILCECGNEHSGYIKCREFLD